jgi:cytochrome c
MKHLFLFLCIAVITSSCGNNNEKAGTANETEPNTATENQPATTTKMDPEAEKGLALVGKSDCFTCHKIVETSIGPAYEAIAEKYPNTDEVNLSLAQKIIKGGAGNWGTVPMTPHPDISTEDAKLMVTYIQSLKP